MSGYDEQRLARISKERARAAKTSTTTQVGGSHYESTIQPVDYIAANNLGFFEGNAIKYITRWKKKGGVEDLRKAQHYLSMLIQQEVNK